MTHLHFNHLAILTLAVAQWLLGALWFSPLFFMNAKRKAMGTTRKPKNAVAGMVVTFIASLFLTLILDHVILWSGADNFVHGAFIGFIAWLGFYAAPAYALSLFEDTLFTLVAINAGYWMVCTVVSGGVLAIWK
jgi:hypothetical protein